MVDVPSRVELVRGLERDELRDVLLLIGVVNLLLQIVQIRHVPEYEVYNLLSISHFAILTSGLEKRAEFFSFQPGRYADHYTLISSQTTIYPIYNRF